MRIPAGPPTWTNVEPIRTFEPAPSQATEVEAHCGLEAVEAQDRLETPFCKHLAWVVPERCGNLLNGSKEKKAFFILGLCRKPRHYLMTARETCESHSMMYTMISTYLTPPEMWLHEFTWRWPDEGWLLSGLCGNGIYSWLCRSSAPKVRQGLMCDLAQRKVRRSCLMELISVKPTEMKHGR